MGVLNASITDGVGHLELNRPEVRNAINRELIDALHETLDRWAERDDLRAVVLSGAGGKAFAGGADIAELKERTHREAFFGINQRLFQKLEDFPRPVIAAIDGYALGGGLELALSCDLRVASKTAKVGMPEVSLGIFPGAGGTWRLPRVVGFGHAKELIFTGRILDAEEAFSYGLFERLVDADALSIAKDIAAQIAKNSPLAVQVAKVSLNALARQTNAEPVERLAQALLFDSVEKRERMTAFLEKKKKG
ncbi:MAG: enoyl-CoA hydratase/isomerase family protein [Myxococcaceae bacterium]